MSLNGQQIMSKDKYPSIFWRQNEAIVFCIFQIFFETSAVLKIGEYANMQEYTTCKTTPRYQLAVSFYTKLKRFIRKSFSQG